MSGRFCKKCGRKVQGVHSCIGMTTTLGSLRQELATELLTELDIDLFLADGMLDVQRLERLVDRVIYFTDLSGKYEKRS